jgi:hypothetical protein
LLIHPVIGSKKRPPPTYSTGLEKALRSELFAGYSVLQRPTKRVNVYVELTLLTVNDLVCM